MHVSRVHVRRLLTLGLIGLSALTVRATPANKAALEKHYDDFLIRNLQSCSTCHLPATVKNPENIEDIPHNPFGERLRAVGKQMVRAGEGREIAARLARVAKDDSDGDGVENEVELLLGHNPGDANDTPSASALIDAPKRREEFAQFLASYRWDPFRHVQRPTLPQVENSEWVKNPIDAFIAAGHQKHRLTPRPEAPKSALLRRVYLDLIGLSPTPEEQRAFAEDHSAEAYAKVVDRLLNDPRYGERWGRHWMDVWRYSDWAGWSGGNQIRDSKPHIWRWRDWIVESLNADKGYDQMVVEMLAADELAPSDTNAVRATGFLARNYKMLSREQWLEDTVKHTSQAFLGATMGCAKCHDHMYDPISQEEYYRLRAIFEPHQVRTDRIPGELDRGKNGLVRVFDVETNTPTYFFVRGDERLADTNRVLAPGVPKLLSGDKLKAELAIEPIQLPGAVAHPDSRDFVIQDLLAAGKRTVADARAALEKARSDETQSVVKIGEKEFNLRIAEAQHAALEAVLEAERAERDSDAWKQAATDATARQRVVASLEAELKLFQARAAQTEAQARADEAARNDNKEATEKAAKVVEEAVKKVAEAEKVFAEAEKQRNAEPSTAYKPREVEEYPAVSTGRRLAFARWVADKNNPLTARVAMNHIWLRHFGRGIVNTPADFGRNGAKATHPELLDWLAAEFMAQDWSMKAMHRLIVTSSTYRMASTPDNDNLMKDEDNRYLWRMPSRRLEAEVVRDNLLFASGTLDLTMGGPEIDHNLGLSSKRRSIYLRIANEKEVEFLKIFDGPAVTECYQRHPSVMPQQALALANSRIALEQAKALTDRLSAEAATDREFVEMAFARVLARQPSAEEWQLCRQFLNGERTVNQGNQTAELIPASLKVGDGKEQENEMNRQRQNLILVLFNHNDFVTVR